MFLASKSLLYHLKLTILRIVYAGVLAGFLFLVCGLPIPSKVPSLSHQRLGDFLFLFRWFIVHNSFVHNVSVMFNKENIGPMPPPVMLLSDGGHVENLALLPLLKKRMKKIVVVDGGFKNNENLYGDSLLNALILARKELNCSFLSEEGGDVISDLSEKFVKPTETGKKPRFYRFVVVFLFRLRMVRLITNEKKIAPLINKKCGFQLVLVLQYYDPILAD